ncbi:hypothetical protein HPB50_015423 [Hyalomma asiaticum]|uniref:Uncharacterized protein n=1 Tax=Hyalomma asiaticum TaxID=266040 RepID=A0ACB7SFK6_HYAAI|nr:hypothetical protein HPB50_015423 [Hyalomma asiaticum]
MLFRLASLIIQAISLLKSSHEKNLMSSGDAQLHEAIQQSKTAHEAEEANNKLQSLEDISSRFHRLHRNGFWTNVCCDNCITFAHLEPTTQAPELLASVTVSAYLRVYVFWKHVQLASNEEIYTPGQVLDLRVLENLLDSVQDYCMKQSHQEMDKVSAVLNLRLLWGYLRAHLGPLLALNERFTSQLAHVMLLSEATLPPHLCGETRACVHGAQ